MDLDPAEENVEYNPITLEELRMGIYVEISQKLANVDVGAAIQFGSECITVIAKTSIFAQRLDMVTVNYPATWWQHVKKDLMPGWFVRRFQVVEIKRVMRLYGAYPNMPRPPVEKYGVPNFIVKIGDKEGSV